MNSLVAQHETRGVHAAAGLEYAIDLSTSSGEADSENVTDDSDSDEVSIADLVGNFSDGLKLEHAFPVFYNDIHDSGGKSFCGIVVHLPHLVHKSSMGNDLNSVLCAIKPPQMSRSPELYVRCP